MKLPRGLWWTLATSVAALMLSATSATAQEAEATETQAEGEAAEEQAPSDTPGCQAALTLMNLSTNPGAALAADERAAVLEVPAESICWTPDATECSPDNCPTKPRLGALVQLYFGPYGFSEHTTRDPAFRRLFAAHLAEAIDARAESGKTTIIEVLDGVPFEDFVAEHSDCCVRSRDFEDLITAFEKDVKEAALRRAVPKAKQATAEALEALRLAMAEESMADAIAARAAREADERAKARLEAELKRRLIELYAATDRARRAAAVAEIEQRRLRAEELAALANSPEETAETIIARCREAAAMFVVGDDDLQRIGAEVYCLANEAKAYPGAIPRAQLKEMIKLYKALQETVIAQRLEDLRWNRDTFSEAPGLLLDIAGVPLVGFRWMSKQHRRVYKVCTDHIADLSGGSHDDVLLAADWIGSCLANAPRLHRKWERKIASKLAKAKAWEEKAEAEAASADGATPTTCDRTYTFCANRCSAAHCITVRSCIENCMEQQRFRLEDCPPAEGELLQCVP